MNVELRIDLQELAEQDKVYLPGREIIDECVCCCQ